MAIQLPTGAPQTLSEAFGYIKELTEPTLDDLKMMVLVEAAGQELYFDMSAGSDNPEVVALLKHNGRDELAHSHRISKAILAISGESYPPPEASDNPYLQGPIPRAPLTVEGLRGLAEGEFDGEQMYEAWAASTSNEEAARLFRLNGKEEADHGNRLLEAAGLLGG